MCHFLLFSDVTARSLAVVYVGTPTCRQKPQPHRSPPPSRGVLQYPANSSRKCPAWFSKVQHAGRAGPCWTMLDHLRDTHTRDRTSHVSTKKEKVGDFESVRPHYCFFLVSRLSITENLKEVSSRCPITNGRGGS
jgi:hypothetical protein